MAFAGVLSDKEEFWSLNDREVRLCGDFFVMWSFDGTIIMVLNLLYLPGSVFTYNGVGMAK